MSEIGYEAADPPHFPSFEEDYTDGKALLMDWLPDFDERAEDVLYTLITGSMGEARVMAEKMVKDAADLWRDR